MNAVREVVGSGFPIGYRMSADGSLDGGLTMEEHLRVFGPDRSSPCAPTGIDLIDVSAGSTKAATLIIQGPAPDGFSRRHEATMAGG